MNTILPLPFWMALCLALALLLRPGGVLADTYTATSSNGDSVTLYDKPCELGAWFASWRKGSMIYKGKQYDMCWRVLVLDSEGDFSAVSISYFRKDESI